MSLMLSRGIEKDLGIKRVKVDFRSQNELHRADIVRLH